MKITVLQSGVEAVVIQSVYGTGILKTIAAFLDFVHMVIIFEDYYIFL